MSFPQTPMRPSLHAHRAWGIAVALALTPVPVRAVERQAWEQEKVTQIARELAQCVAEMREAFRQEPIADLASLQMNARYRLEEKLRLLDSETWALWSHLETGQGLDATLPIYDRIGSLARDAREEARRQSVAKPVQDRVDHAEATWARLIPYYAKEVVLRDAPSDRQVH